MERLVRGHRVHIQTTTGAGVPVILLHSTGLTSGQWVLLQRRLRGRPTYAPDLVGYGKSAPWTGEGPKPNRIDEEVVEAVLQEVSGPVDLVGHSYGGYLAMRAALAHPDRVRRVAVHEPVLWGCLRSGGTPAQLAWLHEVRDALLAVPPGGELWLRGFIDFWNGPGSWDALSGGWRARWLRDGAHISAEVHGLIDDPTPHTAWRQVRAPTLITMGRDTPPVQQAVCQLLSQELPHGQLLQTSGGHMAPVRHTVELAELLSRALRQ